MIKICATCGKAFNTRSKKLTCSEECRQKYEKEYAKRYKLEHPCKRGENLVHKRYERNCAICGASFVGFAQSKYCSTYCATVAARRQKREYSAAHSNAKPKPPRKPEPKPEDVKKLAQPKKQHFDHLDMVAKAASEAGMSYGMYVAKQRFASSK